MHRNNAYTVRILAPSTKEWATIHAFLALVAQNRWNIHHMDANITFLNGDLKENVYMSQP
jgi:hypothetical protein